MVYLTNIVPRHYKLLQNKDRSNLYADGCSHSVSLNMEWTNSSQLAVLAALTVCTLLFHQEMLVRKDDKLVFLNTKFTLIWISRHQWGLSLLHGRYLRWEHFSWMGVFPHYPPCIQESIILCFVYTIIYFKQTTNDNNLRGWSR